MDYPKTRKCSQVDNYHGTLVPDPYRWLENESSEETKKWREAQVELTNKYLGQIPFRNKLHNHLERLYSFPKYIPPRFLRVGNRYFFSKNIGLEPTSMIYTQLGEDGDEEIFINPSDFVKDGYANVSIIDACPNQKHALVAINQSGSDWTQLRVVQIESRKVLPDAINWTDAISAFFDDGIIYCGHNAPEFGKEVSGEQDSVCVKHHKLGTHQNQDVIIFDKSMTLRDEYAKNGEDKINWAFVNILDDNTLLVTTIQVGKSLYLIDLSNSNQTPKRILHLPPTESFNYCGKTFGKFLVYTTSNARNGKVVLVDPKNPKPENWKTTIPEATHPIEGIRIVCGKLFVLYYTGVSYMLHQFGLDGQFEKEIAIPGDGYLGFSVLRMKEERHEDGKTMVFVTTYKEPAAFYLLDTNTGTLKPFKKTGSLCSIENIELKNMLYKSKDGTSVSITIFHKKGLPLDGNNPTILYGYGGYGYINVPDFSPLRIAFVECGGVYAIAGIRGGGEFGEKWHLDGCMENKQNSIDDFISAAEYLIKRGYTRKERLAIFGGSNGGMMVAACANQRPDLFAVVLSDSGSHDKLRCHLFGSGKAQTREFGCSDNMDEFLYLHKYSSLHNVKENTVYPAMLVLCNSDDNRVPPIHSYKYLAALQDAQIGQNPILLYYMTESGHGLVGKSLTKLIKQYADMLSFTFKNMNFEPDL